MCVSLIWSIKIFYHHAGRPVIGYKLDLRGGGVVMAILAVHKVIGLRLEFEPPKFEWCVILIFF
jgi:hypothetical protein